MLIKILLIGILLIGISLIRRIALKTYLRVADQYYVLANSVLVDRETRVLKQGETFAVFDTYGDVHPVTHGESGIFYRGTRHLSQFEFSIWGEDRPLLLNSTLRDDNGLLKIDMTNRDVDLAQSGFLPKGSLHIHREKFLLDSKCFERITFENYGASDLNIAVEIRIDSDFCDLFEVRGMTRPRRGRAEPVRREGDFVQMVYHGLDGIRRVTRLSLDVEEFSLLEATVGFSIAVSARGARSVNLTLEFAQEDELPHSSAFSTHDAAKDRIRSDHLAGRATYCEIQSSNDQFDEWLRRSTDDLVMMTTITEEGISYPYAGIPWFCAPFGRDGLLTAFECLWANPSLARGVLRYCASTQSQDSLPERDSAPGKIIHEVREGEMANLLEIPFGRYYGSVDSTPLFVALAGSYLSRTNDLQTIDSLWSSIEAALKWIEQFGDLDGDGYIEYQRKNSNGLIQQGWKDSHDSVFHDDGSTAKAPIALCEAQGYVYLAKVQGARMAEALGKRDFAAHLRQSALDLRRRFDRDFWLDELGTFALALDGDKRPCRVATSNAGQCLFTGIVEPKRAARLVQTLMSPMGFSGWGIRTVAKGQSRYNPMSYHNGSVWPHDVALIAYGMARYGFKSEVLTIFEGLFRAARYMELFRMPEVFCGFDRREGEAPTLYPHACSPQAWSAASVYLMLKSILGLSIDARAKKIRFRLPRLPSSIEHLRLSNLQVDGGSIDLVLQNYHNDVSVQVLNRDSGITVSVEK